MPDYDDATKALIAGKQYSKPFHSDGLSQAYWYNKHCIVHFVFLGATSQTFYKIIYHMTLRLGVINAIQ